MQFFKKGRRRRRRVILWVVVIKITSSCDRPSHEMREWVIQLTFAIPTLTPAVTYPLTYWQELLTGLLERSPSSRNRVGSRVDGRWIIWLLGHTHTHLVYTPRLAWETIILFILRMSEWAGGSPSSAVKGQGPRVRVSLRLRVRVTLGISLLSLRAVSDCYAITEILVRSCS